MKSIRALSLALVASVSTIRAEDRPNILLILADNWRWPNAGRVRWRALYGPPALP